MYRSKHKVNGIEYAYGPYRVYPGNLSVSRTFGDRDAKVR